MDNKKTIQRINNLLEINEMSQNTIAKKLKMSKSSFSRIMTGERKISSEELDEMSNIFKVSTDYLLGKNKSPIWATTKDVVELDKFLASNGAMSFEGVQLTKSQKERVRKILTEVFWEELKKDRDNGVR